MPPVNRNIRLLSLMLGWVIALSALIGAATALAPLLTADQRPAWVLFGFELTVLSAGVVGIMFGRGRFSDAPGLALACVAGTVLAASALGWQGAGRQVAGVSLTPFLLARVALAAALGLAAAACVLSRAPGGKAWRLAILGAVFGVPVVVAAAALVHPAGRHAIESALGTSAGVHAAVGVAAFLVFGGLLSASVHLVVQAFEMGRVEGEPGGNDHEGRLNK